MRSAKPGNHLKLVRPQLVERSEKRSKRYNNWGWAVSPSVFTRVRSSRETQASQSPMACEAKEKTKAEKDEKKRTFRVSLQSPLPPDLFYHRSRFLDLRKNTGCFAVSLTTPDDTSVWKCIEIQKINVIWRTWWILLQIANHFIAIHIFKWSFLFLAFDKGDWSLKHLTIKRGIIKTKRLITSPSGNLKYSSPRFAMLTMQGSASGNNEMQRKQN